MTEAPRGGVDSTAVVRPDLREPHRRAPVRTCVGCRGKGGRSDLVRVVMVEGVLVPDLRARLAGRGAWVHPDPACLDLAVRRRALVRALRLDSAPDVSLVRAELEARRAGSPAEQAAGKHDSTT